MLEAAGLEEIIAQNHSDGWDGRCSAFGRHQLMLYAIALGLETRSAFEFGVGASTRTLLAALERTGGRLISCDIEKSEALYACGERFRYIRGDSLEVVPALRGEAFDLVLHDGSHHPKVVEQDLRNILPRMRRGGLLLVHDTEQERMGLKRAIRRALPWRGVERLTLPYGFGLTLLRVNRDFGNGSVEIGWTYRKGAGCFDRAGNYREIVSRDR